MFYYTGTGVPLSSTGNTVKSINGFSGDIRLGPSLTLANGLLSANFLLVGIQFKGTGNVLFTAGTGISLSGTTISNTGVTSRWPGALTVGRGLAVPAGAVFYGCYLKWLRQHRHHRQRQRQLHHCRFWCGGAGNVALVRYLHKPMQPPTQVSQSTRRVLVTF